MTTDEQKLKAIRSILDSDFIASKNRYGNETAQKIISALKQFDPEPFEVEIKEKRDGFFSEWQYENYMIVYEDKVVLKSFQSFKECIDFCAKHGLRVK